MLIIVFWIISFILIGFTIYFVSKIVAMKYKKANKRWGHVYTDNLIKEEKIFKISEEVKIRGWSYGSTDFIDYEHKMPGIIVIPRKDKKYPFFEHWGAHFALQGYPTLCIEVYDKKLSRSDFVTKYRPILRTIKKEFIKDKRVDVNNIIYFGSEDSAKVAILEGLEDEVVKIVCGGSTPKVEISEINQKKGKTYILLVHCKDDKVSPISDYEHNKKTLEVGDNDFLVFDYGGHHIISQEPITSAFFSIRIKQKLQPKYRQIIRKEN